MPLKITIGLGKVARTSRGEEISATCGMEIELDPSAGEVNRDEIQRRMTRGYATCWQAIVEELEKRSTSEANSSTSNNGNASPHRDRRTNHSRLATDAQVKAIHGIAKRKRLNLAPLLYERFAVSSPQDLTVRQASDFIENLKG
jgi:hypothetical protein